MKHKLLWKILQKILGINYFQIEQNNENEAKQWSTQAWFHKVIHQTEQSLLEWQVTKGRDLSWDCLIHHITDTQQRSMDVLLIEVSINDKKRMNWLIFTANWAEMSPFTYSVRNSADLLTHKSISGSSMKDLRAASLLFTKIELLYKDVCPPSCSAFWVNDFN